MQKTVSKMFGKDEIIMSTSTLSKKEIDVDSML